MTVYHSHASDIGSLAHGDWTEEVARMSANLPVHRVIESGYGEGLLVSASSASEQIAFELDAYDPHPEILPTSRGIKHVRLWAEGYWSVGEARDRRYRYPPKACWKKQRRYQAHGRV